MSSDKTIAELQGRSHPLLTSMHAPGEQPSFRVAHGSGVWLTLEDGRVVLDAGSMSSNILGHCHPEIVEAITSAASVVYCGDGAGYGPREQAADDLLRVTFGDEQWADAVLLTVSSSEAADLGLLAQMLTGRETLVSRELAYHGGVGLGREISTHPLWGARLASIDSGTTQQAVCDRRYPPADGSRLRGRTGASGARLLGALSHWCAGCDRQRSGGDDGLQPRRSLPIASVPGHARWSDSCSGCAVDRRRNRHGFWAARSRFRLFTRSESSRPRDPREGYYRRVRRRWRVDPQPRDRRTHWGSALDDVGHPGQSDHRRRYVGRAARDRARQPHRARSQTRCWHRWRSPDSHPTTPECPVDLRRRTYVDHPPRGRSGPATKRLGVATARRIRSQTLFTAPRSTRGCLSVFSAEPVCGLSLR